MLRSPGERGERGLAILLESLKLPAAVGMKVRNVSQSLRGGSGGTINQPKRNKKSFSSPNFLRKEPWSEIITYQQQGSRILAKGVS